MTGYDAPMILDRDGEPDIPAGETILQRTEMARELKLEEERYHNIWLEERSRYHSVSLSEKQLSYTSLGYKPSALPDEYDSTTLPLVYIGSIHRIALAFDLHWQVRKNKHEWELKRVEDHSDQRNNGCEEYVQKGGEAMIDSLMSFGEGNFSFGISIPQDQLMATCFTI
jgi:hypothetical protein